MRRYDHSSDCAVTIAVVRRGHRMVAPSTRWQRCRPFAVRSKLAPPFTTSGPPFGGRQNPHRELLYWGVMRVWTDRLGGELRYSNGRADAPRSPDPVLCGLCRADPGGRNAGISTIADIIDRERKARAKSEDDKRQQRWGGGFDC